MVKKSLCFWMLILSWPLFAQFPPLEISLDEVEAPVNGTAVVSMRAGNNWQNITEIEGTIVFDTLVIDQPMVSFWGLSNPNGAVFQDAGAGRFTFEWESLISIGPTLNSGDVVFTLQFNVIGGVGSASQVNLSNVPVQLYWVNGFGWNGNNFDVINGSVTVVVGDDLIFKHGFDS